MLSRNLFVGFVIHGFVMFFVLSILFFSFIRNTERKLFSEKITYGIDNYIYPQLSKIDEKYNGNLCRLLKNNTEEIQKITKYLYDDHDFSEINNFWLYNIIYICNIFNLVIVVLVCSRKDCDNYESRISLKNLFVENCINFFILGIIEIVFYTQTVMNYTPVRPSYIIEFFVQNLKNYKW